MKKTFILSGLVLALCACGARDDKNETENYPTYDTTEKMEKINDPKNDSAQHGSGNLRHNINDHDGARED